MTFTACPVSFSPRSCWSDEQRENFFSTFFLLKEKFFSGLWKTKFDDPCFSPEKRKMVFILSIIIFTLEDFFFHTKIFFIQLFNMLISEVKVKCFSIQQTTLRSWYILSIENNIIDTEQVQNAMKFQGSVVQTVNSNLWSHFKTLCVFLLKNF